LRANNKEKLLTRAEKNEKLKN